MLNIILQLDSQITNLINTILPHNSFFDLFFSFFSLKVSSIIIWLIIIVFLVIFEEKRNKHFIIYFFLSFLITSFIVNIIIKNIVQRPRPVNTISYSCPKDYSFPSGHAATAFAAAVILSYFDKKRKWFYYLIASLIGLSRIYLFCHFFLDVVGGAVIGIAISMIILKIKIRPIKYLR